MKFFFTVAVLATTCSVAFMLQGCMKDSCRHTYTIYTPVYKRLKEVRAEMKGEAPQPLVNTGKIYVRGNYIYLNEIRKGIHVIDNSDPSQPKNLSFIRLPGNLDLAVKGNYLYADCYSDIVVFDISNPYNITVSKFIDNVIKEFNYYWGNETDVNKVSILVDYASRDTTVTCETSQAWNNCRECKFFAPGGSIFFTALPQSSSSTGTGGSMARLGIVNDYMYGVSSSKVYAFDISNAADPVMKNAKSMGWGIETIYPFQNKLFMGSSSGLYICDITNPADPIAEGMFTHGSSCDPVIADGKYAYVTLHSGTACFGSLNQLDVLDVSDIKRPALVNTYAFNNPRGLSKDGDKLFICDGKAGLKIYSVQDPAGIKLITTIGGIETYDVITNNKTAIVVAKGGLYQYDYSDFTNIRLLSKMSISK